MGLTETSATESAGSAIDAASHRSLLLALDELLEARFNERSWLAFTVAPQLPTGDVFIFGTPDNLQMAGSEYDYADETEDPPSPGQVLDYDAATKVVWVDGSYSDAPTLNRRTVEWQSPDEMAPSTWWLGFTRAERWLPLGLADLVVEDYTDAVAAVNTTFTWRSHWDRYGTIRIHNGNRFALTLEFEGDAQEAVEIPPYGIVCARRPNHDEPFVFESTYLPLTAQDDPAKWEAQHEGQPAAGMDIAVSVFDDLRGFCRFKSAIDTDSTSREQGSFTGAALTGTDYAQDWLIHRGDLLSVVLDKRDGSIVTETLTWGGIGSVPDATWSGHVTVTFNSPTIDFESDATAPSGAAPEEWEHDLIPISTNLTGGAILPLHAGLQDVFPQSNGATPWWCLTREYGEFTSANIEFFSPIPFSSAYEFPLISHTPTPHGITSDPELVIEDEFTAATPLSGIDTEVDTVIKSNSAIIQYKRDSLDFNDWGMTQFDPLILETADTDSGLKWEEATGSPSQTVGRRFTARHPRKYHEAGEVDGMSAVYHQHPQDTDIDGTTDGLGGAVGWAVQPILTSQVQIQGEAWLETSTTKGRDIYEPTDVIHTILENINTANWWLDNRDDMLAVTPDAEYKLISWRVPRLVEHFNDLARAINNVREVTPVTIYDLYKDPLPARVGSESYEAFPFFYVGETPFGVPADWVDGRYDTSDVLLDWATIWGIDLEEGVPDVAGFRSLPRYIIYYNQDNIDPDETTDLDLGDAENNSEISYSESTVNGETYNTWSSWSANSQLYLFGGRGTDTDYRWLSKTEAESVFSDLGVAVPPVPCGELYTPVIESPEGFSQTQGDTRPGGTTERYEADIAAIYRKSDLGGSWIRTIDGADEPFRLIDITSETPRKFHADAGNLEWTVDETDDYLDYVFHEFTNVVAVAEAFAPMRLTPRTVSTSGADAWPTLRRFDSNYPVLLVAAPEPWWEHSYDGVTQDYDANDPDLETGLFYREVSLADMPITVEKLQDWSGEDWPCWHCQVVPRPGILREL